MHPADTAFRTEHPFPLTNSSCPPYKTASHTVSQTMSNHTKLTDWEPNDERSLPDLCMQSSSTGPGEGQYAIRFSDITKGLWGFLWKKHYLLATQRGETWVRICKNTNASLLCQVQFHISFSQSGQVRVFGLSYQGQETQWLWKVTMMLSKKHPVKKEMT